MKKIALYGRNVAIAMYRVPASLVRLYRPRPTESYILNVLVTVDEFGNAITGGDPGETISSRSAKARNEGRAWGCVMCRFLGVVATMIARKPTDHCALSLDASAGRNAVIPD